MNRDEFQALFAKDSAGIIGWCKDHPKVTLVAACIIGGVIIGLYLAH